MGAWVSAFLPQLVLLDNQLHDGRAGVRVYQLAVPDGVPGSVLVDLGWLPLPADRKLPRIVALTGMQTVQGLLSAPPSSGLAIGPALAAGAAPQTWLATRLDTEALRSTLGRRDISSQVLRLDPALPVGYVRDLEMLPNTLPPRAALGLRGAMVRAGCRGPGDRDAADMACAPPPRRALTPAA